MTDDIAPDPVDIEYAPAPGATGQGMVIPPAKVFRPHDATDAKPTSHTTRVTVTAADGKSQVIERPVLAYTGENMSGLTLAIIGLCLASVALPFSGLYALFAAFAGDGGLLAAALIGLLLPAGLCVAGLASNRIGVTSTKVVGSIGLALALIQVLTIIAALSGQSHG